jgi:hypothetical protein
MGNMKPIKDADLKQILAEVEAEVGTLFKAEAEKLIKGEGSPESSPAESSPGEGSAGGEASAGGPPAASPAGAPSAPPAAPAGMAPGAPASPSPAGAPADPAAAMAPPSQEELVAEYSKLPPEELKSHYLAAKAALFQVMGGAGDMGAGAPPAPGAPPGAAPVGPGASPSPAGAPAPAGDVPPAPPAMKGEMPYAEKIPGNDEHGDDTDPTPTGTGMEKPILKQGGKGKVEKGAMPYGSKKEGADSRASDSDPTPSGTGQTLSHITSKKSEAALQSELAELKKGVEVMTGLFEKMINQPQRKAFTGVEDLQIEYVRKNDGAPLVKSEKLKKSASDMTVVEVKEKLKAITALPTLKKSDRQRINDFYDNKLGVEDLKDLLEA